MRSKKSKKFLVEELMGIVADASKMRNEIALYKQLVRHACGQVEASCRSREEKIRLLEQLMMSVDRLGPQDRQEILTTMYDLLRELIAFDSALERISVSADTKRKNQ